VLKCKANKWAQGGSGIATNRKKYEIEAWQSQTLKL
jgi:hypothetical protein